jgi:ribA/ribD-fused uncharacterized protein
MSDNIIMFNSKSTDHSWLSNFYISEMLIDGKKWKTVEHYFQSQKFIDSQYQEKIRSALSPSTAKVLGRSRDHEIKADWDSLRLNVMETAVFEKFQQHSELRGKLVATGSTTLQEISRFDRFWAVGKNGNGMNNLGRIIMKVRESLISP